LKSFKYAFNGLKVLFKEEHNARIHLTIAILTIIAGFLLNISASEWVAVCILIGLIFSMEIINSVVENICDFVSPDWHASIKRIKDLMAAAVLITAVVSVICGIIIFGPKLFNLIFG
jgi:undecaprenol kinase/diacylglycerol kinase (ATP)